MKTCKLIISVLTAAVISACGSTAKQPVAEAPVSSPAGSIPQWVLNPVVEDGIAAADCVSYSGNFSVDQKKAAANARVALAQQIETRVQNLDKTYSRRTDAQGEVDIGETFTSVSKQLTNQKLSGSRVVKSDIIKIVDKDHYCALMTLSPTATKELFESIVQASKRPVNPQDEKFLYEEFKAHKAEQSLDKAIANLTN